MKLKSSHIVAISIGAAVVLLFVVGGIVSSFGKDDKKAAAEAKASTKIQDPLVQAVVIQETQQPYVVSVRGRTEANRTVVVRAETAGPVAATPAREGGFVARGAVLCRISTDARQASLDQARAMQKTRELEKQASDRLAAQGYRSQTQVLQAQANLDGATAQVRQAQVLLDQVNIRAPFNGVFDRREAEIGTYLAPGGACGTMIQLDPLVIISDVAERDVSAIQVGSTAVATLTNGERLTGRVRLVARDRVAFTAVTVLDETPEGVWVVGLRGPARVITVGQSYVSEGQKVRLPAAKAAAAAQPAPAAVVSR